MVEVVVLMVLLVLLVERLGQGQRREVLESLYQLHCQVQPLVTGGW